MWINIKKRDFFAHDISSEINTVRDLASYEESTEKGYENKIRSDYRGKDYTYIPFVSEEKFFNMEANELKNIKKDQIVEKKTHLMDVMDSLTKNNFLLTKNRDYTEDYGIITLADINKRPVKDMIYPTLSELVLQLSKRIKNKYESEDLIGNIGPYTVGNWYKQKINNANLHLAEYLTLGDIKGVLRGDDGLQKDCNFANKTEVSDCLGSIIRLRNRVMHGNRTFASNRKELKKNIESIKTAESKVKELKN